MAELVLKKGKFSSALRSGLEDYYSKAAAVEPAFIASRWELWKKAQPGRSNS